MTSYLLAIDQGTTSSRAMLFTEKAEVVAIAQQPFSQYFPQSGWVEHDAKEILQSVIDTVRAVLEKAGVRATEIVGLGITNQRETIVAFDKADGKPLAPAIVWQDRRTAGHCDALRAQNAHQDIRKKTGLVCDPYFSASKMAWLLEYNPAVQAAQKRGTLAMGTIDTYLLWHLTGGEVFATDATNASRTMLFNIHRQTWDTDLLNLFGIPASVLPKVCDCAHHYGETQKALFGATMPITGVIGDQQGALIGQACFEAGEAKSTYGTGCFLLVNTGKQVIATDEKLLQTVAYRLHGEVHYAVEGSIFSAGAVITWLVEQMKILKTPADSEALAASVADNGGIFLVPAFTGLGAPHWKPEARGMIVGLERGTQDAHIVRAALESVVYQTKDLLGAMLSDTMALQTLRVDGGMTDNHWLLQHLADVLSLPIEKSAIAETTALGAAFVAGLGAGVFQDVAAVRACRTASEIVAPSGVQYDDAYQRWLRVVMAVKDLA